jgi:hypothetical protein
VKTLQDRPRLLRVHSIPIAQLVDEADEDFHLVLESGAEHMIAESPSSACARGATPYRRQQMRAARKNLRLCSQARVVGVAFFDFKHGQTESPRTRSSCIRSSASPASRVRKGRRRTESPDGFERRAQATGRLPAGATAELRT